MRLPRTTSLTKGTCLAAMLCACIACASEPLPASQVVLYFDTDAPVPSALEEHPPLFDTLRIDVYAPGSAEPCEDCSREFGVDRDMFIARAASFGVRMQPGVDGYRVRVRLFRTRYRIGGEPPPSSSIDAFVHLPPVAEGEVAEHHLLLPTDLVAQQMGTLDAPIEPEAGPLTESRVGSWIARVSCTSEARDGEVCIPGGAFWMGSPRVLVSTVHNPIVEEEAHVDEQRLVVLSPFFLDATEVTVGAYQPRTPGVPVWSEDVTGDDVHDFYTWSKAPERAAFPVNGLAWDDARAYCQARGADLPTEAQLEYAAGGLRGDDYVWGNAIPACSDAVWGRAGRGIFSDLNFSCNPDVELGGVRPVGSAALDRLALPDGDLVDLTGNVSEWVLDGWASQDSECWPTGVVRDPLCEDHATRPEMRTLKGGNWAQPPAGLLAAVRGAELTVYPIPPTIGFRCARPDAAEAEP